MLNQFFADWNAAIQARKVTNEKRGKNGVIIYQETEFMFRNIKIKMFSKLRGDDENKPEHQRRWMSELFVPSTNKIIPSIVFPTKAQCAAAILSCLVEGRDHEDKVHARIEKRKELEIQRRLDGWKARLQNSSFKDEIDFVLEWIENNAPADRTSWSEDLITVLQRYDYFITGVGLEEHVSLSKKDLDMHQKRMFNTACALISEAIKDRNGVDCLPRKAITFHFLAPKEDIPQSAYVVRSAYSKINDMCPYSNKMLFIVKFMAEYFAKTFGTTVEQAILDYKKFKEAKFNRKAEEAGRGEVRKHSGPKVKFNKQNTETSTRALADAVPITSMGDIFGDVLDKAIVEKPAKKKKPAKIVTDNQINGKISSDLNAAKQQAEVAAKAAAEPEDIAAQQEAFARRMMQEEEAVAMIPEDLPDDDVIVEEVPTETSFADEMEELLPKKKKGSKKKSKVEEDWDAEDMAVIKKSGKGKKKATRVDLESLED